MTDALNTVRMLVSAQLVATVFLSVLLWSLHTRLRHQEFNRWWASAWTVSALFLTAGRAALMFPQGWSVAKGAAVLLTTMLGLAVAPLLVFGAVSFRSPAKITRPIALGGIAAAAAAGAGVFTWSLAFAAHPLTSFSIRNGTRSALLAAALFFCAWAFLDRARATGSRAAMVTGVSCLAYAIDQSVYLGAHLVYLIDIARGLPAGASLLAPLTSLTLLSADVILTCAICVGMILVLVEEYQRAERALVTSVGRELEVTEENTALHQEIVARQRMEQELRVSEDRYRDLVEHSEDLLFTHDLDGRILSCNATAAGILGYEAREMLRMSVRDFLVPGLRMGFDEYIAAVRRDGMAEGLMTVVTRGGDRRVWACRSVLRTEGVAVPIVRGMAHDVTEQRRAERALKRSEERFAAAFRSNPSSMVISSLEDGRFLDVNDAFASQCGYSRAELIDRRSIELNLWVDPADLASIRQTLFEHGRTHAREVRLRHRSGSIATVMLSAEVVPVGGERCVLWAGLDITARKEAEARNQAILRALPDLVLLTSSDGAFLECHARDQRQFALPLADCVGRHVMDVFPAHLSRRIITCFQEARRSDQPSTLEYSLVVGGEDRFYEMRSVPSDGDQILSVVRDVTDRKAAEHHARELQAELAHAGRVMALGTLTGSLAHEINQPLAAIRANAEAAERLLGLAHPDMNEVRAAIDDIVSDNRRIDEVLRRLRSLLRKEVRDYAPVDVNSIVEEVLALAHSDGVRRQISVDVTLERGLPRVLGDRIQLQQVVLNLLMNAYDAVVPTDVGQRRITLSTAMEDGRVIVAVADRGTGVTDEEFQRMFEPFFTTKSEGMGLGLSICRTIVDSHGGVISARRNADRGLTCSFGLPTLARTQTSPSETAAPSAAQAMVR